VQTPHHSAPLHPANDKIAATLHLSAEAGMGQSGDKVTALQPLTECRLMGPSFF
jgi:hypothetical protein